MIPHFDIPFRIDSSGSAVVNDQDTDLDILAAAEAILLCPQGHRPELPDFGRPDLAFDSPAGAHAAVLADTVNEWEPRAASVATVDLDQLITRITVHVQPASGGA